jgi:RNase P protein component
MPQIRKKTWLIDQTLVDRVRRVYGARTETEAVSRALEDAVVRNRIKRGFRVSAGKIPHIEKVF